MSCPKCHFENPQYSVYCQQCGCKLKKKSIFQRKKNNANQIFFAGMGQKGSSIAPLGGMAIANQAKQFADYKRNRQFPKIKIYPLSDGTWYCPLCGDKNNGDSCKGCGFEQ